MAYCEGWLIGKWMYFSAISANADGRYMGKGFGPIFRSV